MIANLAEILEKRGRTRPPPWNEIEEGAKKYK